MAIPKSGNTPRLSWTQPSSLEFAQRTYVALIMAFMAAGIFVAAFFGWLAHLVLPMHNEWVGVIVTIVAFFLALAGQDYYEKHDEPIHSLLGYFLVAAPFGAATSFVMFLKDTHRPMKVVVVVFCLVCVLGVVGSLIKRSLDRYVPWLLGALIVLILGTFVVPFFGFGAVRIWDWVGIAIFSFIVIWNFNRAVREPHTLDNSIDWAARNFMSFLNMAIRGNPNAR